MIWLIIALIYLTVKGGSDSSESCVRCVACTCSCPGAVMFAFHVLPAHTKSTTCTSSTAECDDRERSGVHGVNGVVHVHTGDCRVEPHVVADCIRRVRLAFPDAPLRCLYLDTTCVLVYSTILCPGEHVNDSAWGLIGTGNSGRPLHPSLHTSNILPSDCPFSFWPLMYIQYIPHMFMYYQSFKNI